MMSLTSRAAQGTNLLVPSRGNVKQMETGMEPNQSVKVCERVDVWPYLAELISSGSFFSTKYSVREENHHNFKTNFFSTE